MLVSCRSRLRNRDLHRRAFSFRRQLLDPPLRLAAGPGQRFYEENSMLRLTKDVLPPISAAHDVIGCAWVLNSNLSN